MEQAVPSTCRHGSVVLANFRAPDLNAFLGPARFRVAAGKTFLMVSPAFSAFSFDIVWTPATALSSGEPALPASQADQRIVLNFVLVDGTMTIRGIRSSSISPACVTAVQRTQEKLLRRAPSQAESLREMQGLFARYPGGFRDRFFHESCAFGD